MTFSKLFKTSTLAGVAVLLTSNVVVLNAHAIADSSIHDSKHSFINNQHGSVQLLIPIKSGLEFSRLQKVYKNVKILETSSGVVVLVSDFKRASSAYELGKNIQKDFGFAFQLSYSKNHPDLNMAWLKGFNSENANVGTLDNVKSNNESIPPVKQPKVVYSEDAKDLGILNIKSSWVDRYNSKKSVPFNVNPVEFTKRPALQPLPSLTLSSRYEKLNNTQVKQVSASNQDIHSSKKKVSLISPVAIKPVNLGNIYISPAKYLASNASINYVYVNIASNSDFAKIAKLHKNPTIVRNTNNQLVAKIGVYTNTNLGIRLRDNKISELKSSGFTVKLFKPTSIVA
jgi:hypothetical protein